MIYLEIQKLGKNDEKEWDVFVKKQNGTIFHTIGWRNVLEDTYRRYTPVYYIIKNEKGEIIGVSPAFVVKKFFGETIVSQPFAEYGSPLLLDEGITHYKDLLDIYKHNLVKGGKYIEFRNNMCLSTKMLQIFLDCGFKNSVKAHTFHLETKNKNLDDIWYGLFNKKRRQEIKKGLSYGLAVREVLPTTSNIKNHYILYLENMKELKSPPHSEKFFSRMAKHLTNNMRMTKVFYRDNIVASMISFVYNNNIHTISMCTDSAFKGRHSYSLLFYDAIKYAINNKLDYVDFGRSELNSPQAFFKEKWGAKPIPLVSYIYPPKYQSKIYIHNIYRKTDPIRKLFGKVLINKQIGPFIKQRFP